MRESYSPRRPVTTRSEQAVSTRRSRRWRGKTYWAMIEGICISFLIASGCSRTDHTNPWRSHQYTRQTVVRARTYSTQMPGDVAMEGPCAYPFVSLRTASHVRTGDIPGLSWFHCTTIYRRAGNICTSRRCGFWGLVILPSQHMPYGLLCRSSRSRVIRLEFVITVEFCPG